MFALRLSELLGQQEERERSSEAVIQTMEKEISLRQQATDLHKRKVNKSTLMC